MCHTHSVLFLMSAQHSLTLPRRSTLNLTHPHSITRHTNPYPNIAPRYIPHNAIVLFTLTFVSYSRVYVTLKENKSRHKTQYSPRQQQHYKKKKLKHKKRHFVYFHFGCTQHSFSHSKCVELIQYFSFL